MPASRHWLREGRKSAMSEAAQVKPKTPRIPEGDYIPHELVGLHAQDGIPFARAWREYLGLTQAEVAERAGITQSALSQMESGEAKLRKATRKSWHRPWA
ncbi:MAG: helix-turn-helix domain-containing protein [Desulfobulbia bacterium]